MLDRYTRATAADEERRPALGNLDDSINRPAFGYA
jgi:hypothetical protein